ncbi:Hypothetical protein SMAX5B_017347 [Scophthalmus maximus]|uniref:Uncharacterized protein n=1 Tax=Scophthalmus maximus TaxID=52904 RepID=A0A2U9CMD2_SCOMX|nr:Hypothetical protein SMAX5B_017347 [Scophthalmus maximus]
MCNAALPVWMSANISRQLPSTWDNSNTMTLTSCFFVDKLSVLRLWMTSEFMSTLQVLWHELRLKHHKVAVTSGGYGNLRSRWTRTTAGFGSQRSTDESSCHAGWQCWPDVIQGAESLVAAGLLPLLCPTPGIFLNPINDLWVVESRDRWSLVCFHTSLALNCTSLILVLVITTNTSMGRSLASASSKSSSSKLPEHVLSDYFPACLSCPQQITSGGILISSATGAT